jgi:hypothetical protein
MWLKIRFVWPPCGTFGVPRTKRCLGKCPSMLLRCAFWHGGIWSTQGWPAIIVSYPQQFLAAVRDAALSAISLILFTKKFVWATLRILSGSLHRPLPPVSLSMNGTPIDCSFFFCLWVIEFKPFPKKKKRKKRKRKRKKKKHMHKPLDEWKLELFVTGNFAVCWIFYKQTKAWAVHPGWTFLKEDQTQNSLRTPCCHTL